MRTWVDRAHPRMVVFAYELSAGGRKLATGYTKHLFSDREFKPARLPEKYWAAFGIG